MTRTSPALVALGFASGLVGAALAQGSANVTQKSRVFQPSTVAIARGETVRIVNDDGELLHHAFVDTPTLKFDSGEQEPGSAVSIRFASPGEYPVRCAIHPRMRLLVTVR